MLNYPFTFPKIGGHLVGRINRFTVEVDIDGRREKAYLANPGRLWELLLPGTELLLTPALSTNKLPYTVLACRKDNRHVLLHTHLTNKVIRSLLKEGRLSPFAGYSVIKEEPVFGSNRFDLLLEHKSTGAGYYLEIKTCTLFDGSTAMFPDAVSKRGLNHLYKLKELADSGIKTGCLFAVMNPEAKYFLPAYHIDFNFARAFMEIKNSVELTAAALGFDQNFTAVSAAKKLTVPYSFLESELQDRGVYLLLIEMKNEKTVTIGGLGQTKFKRGHYIYVGSAARGLSKRTARHTRKSKQKRWHIDYLIAEAEKVNPVPIISGDSLECALADSLQKAADYTVKGFGSSDCGCSGHLFYFAVNPLHNSRLIEIIQHYRIRRLEKKFNSL